MSRPVLPRQLVKLHADLPSNSMRRLTLSSFPPSISFWGGLPAGQNRSAPGLESAPALGT